MLIHFRYNFPVVLGVLVCGQLKFEVPRKLPSVCGSLLARKTFVITFQIVISLQVADDYGIDWTGPHNPYPVGVTVPDAQLPRQLTQAEVASLPDPHIPFSAALQAYMDTVNIIKDIFQQT